MSMAESDKAAPAQSKVFISYSRKDARAADALAQALQQLGHDVYVDRKDIAAAEVWRARLETLILSADAVVFVLSPDAVRSEVCSWEVERTLALGKKLVPLVWRKVDPRKCPRGVSERNWVGAASSWRGAAPTAPVIEALHNAISTDIEWERERSVWTARAVRWSDTGRPSGLLLRSEETDAAETWAARRPAQTAAPASVLLEFMAASRDQARVERNRLRSISGRAFVSPIAQALRDNEPDRALRMLATAAVLADDVDFELVPQLWKEGARSLMRRPLAAISDETPLEGATDPSVELAEPVCGVSADGVLCAIQDVSGDLRLLEFASATELWRVRDGPPLSAVIVTEGFGILGACESGEIVCFDRTAGKARTIGNAGGAIFGAIWSEGEACLLVRTERALLRCFPADGRVTVEAEFDCEILDASYDTTARSGVMTFSPSDEVSAAQTFGAIGVKRYDCDRIFMAASISKDGRTLCLADSVEARIYDVGADQPRARVRHGDKVVVTGADLTTAALTSDGAALLTASYDGTARLWDARTGKELMRFDHVDEALIMFAAFSPDETTVLTLGTDCTVRHWSRDTGELLATIANRYDPQNVQWRNLDFHASGFAGDGARIWTQMRRGVVQLWRARDYDEKKFPEPPRLKGTSSVRSLQCLAGGRVAVFLGNGLVQIFDRATETTLIVRGLGDGLSQARYIEAHDVVVAITPLGSACFRMEQGGTLWRHDHGARCQSLACAESLGLVAVGGGDYAASGYVDVMTLAGELRGRTEFPHWTSAAAWHAERGSFLVGDVYGAFGEVRGDRPVDLRRMPDFASKVEAIAVPVRGAHFYVAAERQVFRVEADGTTRTRMLNYNGSLEGMRVNDDETLLFADGFGFTELFDLRRGAVLYSLSFPHEVEEVDRIATSTVTDDWSTLIAATSNGRRLERSLEGVAEMASRPGRAVAAALSNGNDKRRYSERVDVLMSEQPVDLIAQLEERCARQHPDVKAGEATNSGSRR